MSSRRRPKPAAWNACGAADEKGHFVVGDLLPGRYLVRATTAGERGEGATFRSTSTGSTRTSGSRSTLQASA